MTIDLTDVSRQVQRLLQFRHHHRPCGCAQVAYKCLTSPTDYPINDGSFRSLKAIVPPGRVVSAVRPAPMRWWMTFPMTIVDTVFKALAPAIPDRVIAGHHADLSSPAFHGINPGRRSSSSANFGPLGGGWGAKRARTASRRRSASTTATPTTAPSEQAEAKFPLVVERYALIARFGRRRPLPRRARRRARGARTRAHHLQQPDRARALQALGPRGRRRGDRQRGRASHRDDEWKTDFPNAKVLVAHLQARRRLPHALGRRRRLRRAARRGRSRPSRKMPGRATSRWRRPGITMASCSIRKPLRRIWRPPNGCGPRCERCFHLRRPEAAPTQLQFHRLGGISSEKQTAGHFSGKCLRQPGVCGGPHSGRAAAS